MRRALWKNSRADAHADPSSCHQTSIKTIIINMHPLFNEGLNKGTTFDCPVLKCCFVTVYKSLINFMGLDETVLSYNLFNMDSYFREYLILINRERNKREINNNFKQL